MSSLSGEEFMGLGTAITILLIAGCVFQAVSLMRLLRPDFRQFEMTPYFLSIVAANSVVIVVDFPPIVASAWAQKKLLNPVYCQVVGFLSGVGSITTFATLALCSLKTHRKITYPPELQDNSDSPWLHLNVIRLVTPAWLYAIVTMLPALFGWSSFSTESGGIICAPNWREKSTAGRVYLVLLAVLAFLAPLSMCIVFLIKSYRKLTEEFIPNAETRAQRMKMRKTVTMVTIGTVAFAVSWTPYCVCAMMSVSGKSYMFDEGKSFIPEIFAKASFVYNPFICLLVSKRFRRGALNVLPRLLCFKRARANSDQEVYHSLNPPTFNEPDKPERGTEPLEDIRVSTVCSLYHKETRV